MYKMQGTDDCLGKDKLKHQKVLLSVMQQNGQSVAKKLAEIKKNKRKEWSFAAA